MLPILLGIQPISLEALIESEPSLNGSVVGVSVTDAKGNSLYERNGYLRLVPASNQKVLSCVYALAMLGPDWRYQTRVWAESHRTVVDAPGDPTLTRADWLAVRETLPGKGLDPVVVRQAFRVGVPDTWEHDDLPNRYAPRITAFTHDRSGFEIWAENGTLRTPAAELGLKVVVEAKAGQSPRVIYTPSNSKVVITGQLPTAATRLDTLSMPDPSGSTARLIGTALRDAEQVPLGDPTRTLTSPPLMEIAKRCLQPSDNMLAEHLLLTPTSLNKALGREAYSQARARMREFYTVTVGIAPEEIRPMDGSGLSRHNLISARGLTRTLNWARTQPWFEPFRASLAAPGVGTLSSRLRGVPFQGKTGTLSGVVSLSGYLTTASGEELTVAIVVNNAIAPSNETRDAVDRLMRTLQTTGTVGTNLHVK